MVILSYKITKLKEQNVKEFCYLKLSNKAQKKVKYSRNCEHLRTFPYKWWPQMVRKIFTQATQRH